MLRWLVGVCLGLELIYVVGVNGFLNLGGLALLFEGTNTVNATVRRAWSVWPGSVHLRDLRIVFQDANVQFSIDLPRGHANIALLELTKRTFHATKVSGDGLSFRMRHRIQPESAAGAGTELFPPIREFSDPPLFEASAPPPPLSEAEYNLWTVHLEGVDVNAREIWAQHVRYVGPARASGAFRLRPARTLWVGPATLELDAGQLTLGANAELARRLDGRIEATVHFFDVRKPTGMQVFRYVSAGLKLRGDGLRVEPFAEFLPETSGVAFDATPGKLRVDARLDHGRFTEQSALVVELPELRLHAKELGVTARGFELSARGAPRDEGALHVHAAVAEVHRSGARGAPLRATGVSGVVTSSSRDTAVEWSFVDARAAVQRAELADARWLEASLELPGVEIEGGALAGSADAHLAGGKVRGRASATATDLRWRTGSLQSAVDGALEVAVDALSPSERTGELVARFQGARVALLGAGARATAGALEVDARAKSTPMGADADVTARLRRVRLSSQTNPSSRLSAPRITLRANFVEDERGMRSAVASADVPELLAERADVQLQAAFELGTRFVQGSPGAPARLHTNAALRDVELRRDEAGGDESVLARAERFELRSDLRRDARGLIDGFIATDAKALWARVGGTRIRGDPRLKATLRGFDVARSAGGVQAELEVRDFLADDRSDGLTCPWSSIPNATLSADLKLDPGRGASGAIAAEIEKARLVWGDFTASGDATLKVQLAGVSARRGRGQFRLAAHGLALRSGAGIQSGWAARVPTLIVSGELAAAERVTGSLRVSAERSKGRVGRAELETDLGADFRILALDLNAQQASVSGDVRLSRARVSSGDESVDDWWANVDVDSAALSVKENLDLTALFRARLRDALPGIAVLAASGELPGWFGSALPLRELDVTGLVHRRCRLTDIHFTQVSGGPLVSRGRLQSIPEAVRGAFLVRLADLELVSAGLSFNAEHTSLRLLASDGWLRERQGELDGFAKRAVQGVCVPEPRQCGP